jgi:hypothetical protein
MLKTVTNIVNASQIIGVLPVVNGGTGVTTSTGTGNVVLSASPTLSGDVALSTGNIVPSTAAKGVNFTANTPTAGSTSQLLNWYEEGTFTPILRDAASGNAATATTIGRYTRIGRSVEIQIEMTSINTTGLNPGNTIYVTGLPFLCLSIYTPVHVFNDTVSSTTGAIQGLIYTNSFLMVLYNNTVAGNTPAIVSQITSGSSAFFMQANYITS